MLRIGGIVGEIELSGTLYELDETPPYFSGAPDESAPYVWVCDEFYEVESGGQSQVIEDRVINVAFERPMPRGFESRDRAIQEAIELLQTQFARIGFETDEVEVTVEEIASPPS